MERPALLEMQNITKEFPGVKALDGEMCIRDRTRSPPMVMLMSGRKIPSPWL